METINKISIIGVGLIGGSIGLAVKDKFPATEVIGIGRNLERLTLAQKNGCVDKITTDIYEGVKDADIVVVATPVGVTADFVKKVIPLVKNGCVVTDVASVKYKIIKDVSNTVKKYRKYKDVNFIGSHPLAGSEKTGFEYANKNLFFNSICVVCYNQQLCSKEGLGKIKLLWETLGAKVVQLDAKKHDKILAITSHMLHLISYILVKQINSKKGYVKFTAGGYRDMTRIAGSNPELWAEICYINKEFILQGLIEFNLELIKLKKNLKNFNKLKKFLTKVYNLKTKV
ncbi:MAG: prephenate dehydrogenase [Endomicrobia bacterium]|nr:prephenate dehydrogenase [Endomicrobiia bacterium]